MSHELYHFQPFLIFQFGLSSFLSNTKSTQLLLWLQTSLDTMAPWDFNQSHCLFRQKSLSLSLLLSHFVMSILGGSEKMSSTWLVQGQCGTGWMRHTYRAHISPPTVTDKGHFPISPPTDKRHFPICQQSVYSKPKYLEPLSSQFLTT